MDYILQLHKRKYAIKQLYIKIIRYNIYITFNVFKFKKYSNL